ncbi:MAG: hypothetical protein NZ898_06425 [Myxococcota bacterium]|nr:hypothetical protein [Myxococcota bacterium]MDW8362658.1 hypothetical protein [Myxococcales bacterium]
MAGKAPLAIVREKFQDKAGLIKAVEQLAGDDLFLARLRSRRGLRAVSNRKLLRLHALLSAVRKEHGSRAGLIDAILALERRVKDAGYRARLERYPTPRLYDRWRSLARRARAASRTASKAETSG